jgi:hypothetical protein
VTGWPVRAFQLSEVRRKEEKDAQSMGVLIREAFPRGEWSEGRESSTRCVRQKHQTTRVSPQCRRTELFASGSRQGTDQRSQSISRLPCPNRTLDEQDQVNPDKNAPAVVMRGGCRINDLVPWSYLSLFSCGLATTVLVSLLCLSTAR